MRTWGTEVSVADEAGSRAHFDALARRLPEVASAYHPSGALPFTGLLALLVGGALGSVLGAATGLVLAAVSLGLFSLMALLIAVIAACGFSHRLDRDLPRAAGGLEKKPKPAPDGRLSLLASAQGGLGVLEGVDLILSTA
jgi:hypothetical protein